MSSWTFQAEAVVAEDRRPADPNDRPVLVIDDDPFARRLIQYILASRGLPVEVAPDGARGLARARSRRPAVVLVDLNLPDADGEEVAREIRTHYPGSVPIVLMGPADDLELATRSLGSGHGLAKPIDWDAVLEAVQPAVDQPKVA